MKNLNHSERPCGARMNGGSLSQAWQAKSFFLSFSALALALTNSGCSTESIFSSTLKQSAPGVAAHTFQLQEDSELPNQNFDALFESGYSDELIALMRENNPDWNPETAQWNLNGVAMDGVHVGQTWVIDNSVDLTLDSMDPPRWTARPRENFNGMVTAVVRVTEGQFTSEPSTVSFNVNPVNDPPVAQTGNMNAIEDMPSTFFLTAADPDLQHEGDSHTFTLETDSLFGSVIIAPNGMVVYTTDLNSNTPDSFTFRVTDSGGNSSTANVSINVTPVNDPPAAVNASISTNEDTAKNGQLAATDIDSSSLTYTRVTNAQHGNVTVSSNGAYTYTPALNFFGSDRFTFKANDGALDSNVATITITVINVNDPPVAVNYNEMTNEDTVLSRAVVATDPDLDPLTYSRVSNASNGNVIMNSNGTYTYTPNQNYNGPDSFTYRATDPSNANSNTATVFITVNAVNDAPVANNLSITVSENTPHNGQLTASDVDHAQPTLTFALVANGAKGIAQVNPDGSFVYTPNNNMVGNDTFTFRTSDPAGALSNIATVTILILDETTCVSETITQQVNVISKLDVLFVMDTSGSLNAERGAVAEEIQQLVDALPGIHIRFGVLPAHSHLSSHGLRLLQDSVYGEALILDTNIHSMTQIKLGLKAKLINNVAGFANANVPVEMSTDGGEAPNFAVHQLANNVPCVGCSGQGSLDRAKGQGFFREDAALAIIYLTDEDDICDNHPSHGPYPDIGPPTYPYTPFDPTEESFYTQHCVPKDVNSTSTIAAVNSIMGGRPFSFNGVVYTGENQLPVQDENGIAYGLVNFGASTNGIITNTNGIAADMADIANIDTHLAEIGETVNQQITKILNYTMQYVAESVTFVKVANVEIPYTFTPAANRVDWAFDDAGNQGDIIEVNYCFQGNGIPF